VINNAGITSDGLLLKVQGGKVQKKMSLDWSTSTKATFAREQPRPPPSSGRDLEPLP